MQRWGIGIPPSLSMKAIVSLTQQAEAAGAESVWVADIGRDIFTSLTAIAQGTSRVRVGASVAICFARPPALVQLAASDIDEISQGRMVLGIGTAPPAWNENWYGVPKHEKPVANRHSLVTSILGVTIDSTALWQSAKVVVGGVLAGSARTRPLACSSAPI